MTSTHIFCIVINKFSYWKKPSPIILLTINKSFEISLYCIFLPLGLAISLRMKSGEESLPDF